MSRAKSQVETRTEREIGEEHDATGIVPAGDGVSRRSLTLAQDASPEEWPTSLQVGSSRWRAAIVNSACTPDLNIGAEWSEPFTVTDWLVMWREGVDESTGEVKKYPWLSLICANGDVIGTSSAVVPHQLARMLKTYSPAEWAAGIKVKFRRRLNRSGTKTYHEMRVVE